MTVRSEKTYHIHEALMNQRPDGKTDALIVKKNEEGQWASIIVTYKSLYH